MPAILQNKVQNILTIVLLLWFAALAYVFSTGWEPVTYTRDDWIRFTFFTNKLVKNLPDLDDKTEIMFRPQDGSPSTEGYWIDYKKLVPHKKLENYLTASGYRKFSIQVDTKRREVWKLSPDDYYHEIRIDDNSESTSVSFLGME